MKTTFISTLALIAAATAQPTENCTTTPALNLTAISTSNGSSIFECWQLPKFHSSSSAGTVGALNSFLGNLDNATYTVIPPHFDGGLHNAPAPQFVAFLSGLAHITLPNDTAEAWVQGGKYGLIIAADSAEYSMYGHITTYPSNADTIAIQMPFEGGYFPTHSVLYEGPCQWSEMVGI
jgi:hypothetical protein